MTDDHTLGRLAKLDIPAPRAAAREHAVASALQAFEQEKFQQQTQGIAAVPRLTHRILNLWGKIMDRKLLSTSALAGILALPLAGYTALYLMKENPIALESAPVAAYAPEPTPAAKTDAGEAFADNIQQMQQEMRRESDAFGATGIMDSRATQDGRAAAFHCANAGAARSDCSRTAEQ
ncbi:MAG: hypothetical protein QM744_18520 [Mesorhizobium sp.]